MSRALAMLAMLAMLAACAPHVLWSGRTADRQHRIEVIEDGGLQYVTIDAQRRAAYRAIAGWSIAVSDDDHLAFAARVGARWVVVHDDRTSEPWTSVGALQLARGGHLAYAAERDGWYVVADGRAGPRFDAILAGTLRWSRDAGHVAYVGRRGDKVHAVVDGALGPAFDGVGSLAFTSGGQIVYAARDGADAHVVTGGTVGPRWAGLGQIAVAAEGARVAYAAFDGTSWRVVVDGEPGPAVDAVRRIVVRDDGRHVAWVARVGQLDVLALDGAPLAAAPELRPASVAFRPPAAPGDGVGLAYVAPADGGGERVLVDASPGATFDELGAPVWSADGRLGYAARRGGAWTIVVGDRESPPEAWASGPVFSPDGHRVAYVAKRGAASVVVADGREHRFDLVFSDSLVFSSDSRRWAIVAGDLRREQLFFAVEGRAPTPLPATEIYSAAAMGSGHDDALVRWAQAEADRAP